MLVIPAKDRIQSRVSRDFNPAGRGNLPFDKAGQEGFSVGASLVPALKGNHKGRAVQAQTCA